MSNDWDSSLFYVGFEGEELNEHGASIYDLGTALLSVQRIVHKAHLADKSRLIKKAYPRKAEIKELALQMGGRYEGSDLYSLVPIIASASNIEHLKNLAGMVFGALVPYYTQKVLETFSTTTDKKQQALIGSIHAEVVNVVGRIDTQSGLESLTIGSPLIKDSPKVTFDVETRDYLNRIKDERLLGDEQELFARVYKLYPNSNIVGVRPLSGGACSVHLSESDFDHIRFDRDKDVIWRFWGRPLYGLGATLDQVTEFEATNITKLKESS